MGPGPSDVAPSVLAALAAQTVGHLDPYFLRIMDETQRMLRVVFRTTNELTLAVSGTGSAGMEACVVNLIEPGDRMLVCVNGVFGGRMADVAARAGAQVTKIERNFGEIFSTDEVAEAVKRNSPKVVGIVHAETSTGARQPLEEIAKVVHDAGGLLLADCVTSLGGAPVEVDGWQLDAVYSGTQKCLGCPPGLAPVTFSPRALAAIDQRRSKVASWYLDMTLVRNYWGQDRAYHHTAPINMNFGLHEALRIVLEEGLHNRFARHARNHGAVKRVSGRPGNRIPRRGAVSAADAQFRADSSRRRRSGRSQGTAERIRHRDRQRTWAAQRQDLADRIDGRDEHAGQRPAVPCRARALSGGSKAKRRHRCRRGCCERILERRPATLRRP